MKLIKHSCCTISRRMFVFIMLYSVGLSVVMDARAVESQRICIINTARLIEDSKAFHSIEKQIEKQNKQYRDKTQKSESDLKKRHQNLEASKNLLSPEALASKSEKISKDFADLQKSSMQNRKILEKSYNVAVQKLINTVSSTVSTYSKKEGCDIVFDSSSTQYHQPEYDITLHISKILNNTLEMIKVDFPANVHNKKVSK